MPQNLALEKRLHKMMPDLKRRITNSILAVCSVGILLCAGVAPAHCETWKWLVWDWLAGWVLALQYRLFVTHQHTDIQGIVIPANCPFNRYWLAGTVPVHLGNLIRRLSAEKRRRDSSQCCSDVITDPDWYRPLHGH